MCTFRNFSWVVSLRVMLHHFTWKSRDWLGCSDTQFLLFFQSNHAHLLWTPLVSRFSCRRIRNGAGSSGGQLGVVTGDKQSGVSRVWSSCAFMRVLHSIMYASYRSCTWHDMFMFSRKWTVSNHAYLCLNFGLNTCKVPHVCVWVLNGHCAEVQCICLILCYDPNRNHAGLSRILINLTSHLSIFDGSLASVLAKGRQGSCATWRLWLVMSANINLPPVQDRGFSKGVRCVTCK